MSRFYPCGLLFKRGWPGPCDERAIFFLISHYNEYIMTKNKTISQSACGKDVPDLFHISFESHAVAILLRVRPPFHTSCFLVSWIMSSMTPALPTPAAGAYDRGQPAPPARTVRGVADPPSALCSSRYYSPSLRYRPDA